MRYNHLKGFGLQVESGLTKFIGNLGLVYFNEEFITVLFWILRLIPRLSAWC